MGAGSGETYVLFRTAQERFLSYNWSVRFDLAGARRFGSAAEAADHRDRLGGPQREAWEIRLLTPDGWLLPLP